MKRSFEVNGDIVELLEWDRTDEAVLYLIQRPGGGRAWFLPAFIRVDRDLRVVGAVSELDLAEQNVRERLAQAS